MDRPRSPRRRPEAPSAPTTLTEITRRYYATALALSKAMGLPLTETFLREHRESISCCFIEAGRAGVRLPAAVTLPRFAAPGDPLPPGDPAVVLSTLGNAVNGDPPPVIKPPDTPEAGEVYCGLPEGPPPTPPTNGHPPPPTVVPTGVGLPCGGQVIADLKPAQLAMTIVKTARLVHDQGEPWVPLLAALQSERGKRMELGRRPARPGSEEKG